MKRSLLLTASLLATVCTLTTALAVGTGASFEGPIGLQLYSLRGIFTRSLPDGIAQSAKFGIHDVELAGLYNQTPDKLRQMLTAAMCYGCWNRRSASCSKLPRPMRLPMPVKLKCPDCRQVFRWETAEKWPNHCPMCGSDINNDRDDVVMPFITSSQLSERTRASDNVYKQMEQGSEVRAQMASSHLGVSAADVADIKISDLRDARCRVALDTSTRRMYPSWEFVRGRQLPWISTIYSSRMVSARKCRVAASMLREMRAYITTIRSPELA
jgi:hypothetical protein